MSELKTKANDGDVMQFINSIDDEEKKADSLRLLGIMKRLTGESARMWGESIVGFGTYEYKYASGRGGTWFKVGFSPRKQQFSLYIMSGFETLQSSLARLGKHKTGKGCLYSKRLTDIDEGVLEEMMVESLRTFL